MSLPADFLELAKKLVGYKKADLRDTRLRRGISTAYYALFHLLLENGSAKLVAHPGVRQLVSRAYSHADMAKAAKTFKSGAGGLPAHLTAPFAGAAPPLPPEIIRVATAFVVLQEARHEADYNRSRTFSRAEAQELVAQSDQAFTDWNTVSTMPAHIDMCELFLASLLLGERWRK